MGVLADAPRRLVYMRLFVPRHHSLGRCRWFRHQRQLKVWKTTQGHPQENESNDKVHSAPRIDEDGNWRGSLPLARGIPKMGAAAKRAAMEGSRGDSVRRPCRDIGGWPDLLGGTVGRAPTCPAVRRAVGRSASPSGGRAAGPRTWLGRGPPLVRSEDQVAFDTRRTARRG